MTESARPPDLAQVLEMLSGALEGRDPAALTGLRSRLQGIARAHMAPKDGLRRVLDSEDLTQEALCDVIRNVRLFRGRTWAEFHAFLEAVLCRRKADLARHHARLRRRAQRHALPLDELALSSDSPSPSSSASLSEELRRLKALVDTLPGDQGEALRLRLAGHEYAAIAARLGISELAARKRLSRALEALRGKWSGDAEP